MSPADLQERIYAAQCLGNIEPIESMVPYPNLPALIEGQIIKYRDRLLYPDEKITVGEFHARVQKMANWLEDQGAGPDERILIGELPFPLAEILAFGVWTLGGSLVLCGDQDPEDAIKATEPLFCIFTYADLPEQFSDSDVYTPRVQRLLEDEALVYYKKGTGIRLSHYNLLVNTNAVLKHLDPVTDSKIKVLLPSTSPAWVVLQLLLPLYGGLHLTRHQADLVLGLTGQFESPDFLIDMDWKDLRSSEPNRFRILFENTAVLAIGDSPLHLTALESKGKGVYAIEGHSVMQGYLDKIQNETVFREEKLFIDRSF